jgi:cytochrome c-type biogenesis protein CcmH
MMVFWVIGAALAVVALALALRPLLFAPRKGDLSRSETNVSIYRDQLRELEADLASGLLAQADYERARRELEARALHDAAQEAPAAARGGRERNQSRAA